MGHGCTVSASARWMLAPRRPGHVPGRAALPTARPDARSPGPSASPAHTGGEFLLDIALSVRAGGTIFSRRSQTFDCASLSLFGTGICTAIASRGPGACSDLLHFCHHGALDEAVRCVAQPFPGGKTELSALLSRLYRPTPTHPGTESRTDRWARHPPT